MGARAENANIEHLDVKSGLITFDVLISSLSACLSIRKYIFCLPLESR
jgi:hypothetical protein